MNSIVDYKIHYQSGPDNSEGYYLESFKDIRYNFKIWSRHYFSDKRYVSHTAKLLY